jgi:voltage-gated potassium channel
MRWEQLPSGRVRHPFEPIILGLALLVIPVIAVEESSLGAAWKDLAVVANWIIWIGFAVELAFVLIVAPRKLAAVRAHWLDVLIVVLTVPLASTLLAAFRLARLLRLLRLIRLSALGARALQAERALTSRHNFRFIALITGLLVVISGAAVAALEAGEYDTMWDGIWWAAATVTTVGYGDLYPTTTFGRIIAMGLMFVGIGFLSFLTAAIAARFVEEDAQDDLKATLRTLDARLERIEAELKLPAREGSDREFR